MSARRVVIVLCVAMMAIPVWGEVSVVGSGANVGIIRMSPTDSSANEVWEQVRVIAPQLALNPDGFVSGDHSPAFGVNPQTGRPEAVWCHWDGVDTEIVWSRFDGQVWTEPELVTTNSVSDEAPSIAFDVDGAVAIAWESHETTTRVEYRERQTSGEWSPVIHVSDGTANASNPVVNRYEGQIRVGYIQPGVGPQRALIVANSETDPSPFPSYFTPEIIAMISFSGDIAPELHSYPNSLFMTWVNSSTEIGFANFNGTSWQAPQIETYSSTEDLPRARIRAKGRALRNP